MKFEEYSDAEKAIEKYNGKILSVQGLLSFSALYACFFFLTPGMEILGKSRFVFFFSVKKQQNESKERFETRTCC